MLQFYSEFKKSSQIIYIFQIILISLLFEHLSKSTSFLGFFLKKSDKFFPAGRWRRKKKKDRNFSTKVPAECGDSRLVFHILERHECIRGWKKLKRPRKFIRVPLQGYTMLKIELENTRTIFLTRKKKKEKERFFYVRISYIRFSSYRHHQVPRCTNSSLRTLVILYLAFHPFRFIFILFHQTTRERTTPLLREDENENGRERN